ncbi:hypothetical protein BDF22DRAFT_91222 [Syncephalis plumigaleata]|nr:hypothetical protein BDF22DRAFT_91222 [Syncephalis plumigaleata]
MLSSHWSCIIAYFTQTRPPIHSIVIAFLLSTLWLPRLVPAYVVFGNTQRNVTAPTVDYFQQRVKPYDRYGPMVLPAFSANEQCVFKSPSPNPLVANTLAKSGFSTVLAINWTNAMDFGCRNYAHAVHALEMTEDAYQQSGFPSPFTILLMIPVFLPGPFGGPLTDRYIAHDPHVGNEFPTTNVALMNINDYAQFLRNKTDTTSTQYVRIVHEQGSWNSVFLSNEYVGFNWALFSINAIVSVYGLFIFATTLFLRKFAADIRNVVFILGFLAVIANTVAMAHRYANYTRMTLEQVSSCLSCIAFYMLLYL